MLGQEQIYNRLNLTLEQLEAFCKQHHILELSIFGSTLRDDFRSDSDIDMLVVFEPLFRSRMSLMDLVGIGFQLEELSGRKVDLVEKRSVEESHNWIRRNNILNTAQVIYESGRILSV